MLNWKKKIKTYFNLWKIKKKSLKKKKNANIYLQNKVLIKISLKQNKLYIFNEKIQQYYEIYLPKNYYYKINLIKKEVNSILFYFKSKEKYISLLKNFLNNYKNVNRIFFFRVKLKGLGFYVRRLSKDLFYFFMALNHFFFLHKPKNVYIKKKKKTLIFLCSEKDYLMNIFWNLYFLKRHNVYVKTKNISGFLTPNYVRFVKKKNKL